MATPSPEGSIDSPEGDLVRDVAKLVIDHPLPLYDPSWLRGLHDSCLWDGGTRQIGKEFCCPRCEERYADWEHRTTHVVLGREPLQTFLEQGRKP